MDFRKHILSRGLPKTGQTISFEAYDDGHYQSGWWVKRLNANNRTRYVLKDIGGDFIVLDRATGLMWAADGIQAGCNNGTAIDWSTALEYVDELVFAGFADWRMPNILELLSIVNYSIASPCITEPPFINTSSAAYWCSTTYYPDTLKGWCISFNTSVAAPFEKQNVLELRCVRLGV